MKLSSLAVLVNDKKYANYKVAYARCLIKPVP